MLGVEHDVVEGGNGANHTKNDLVCSFTLIKSHTN
jgi:hypothetical protein